MLKHSIYIKFILFYQNEIENGIATFDEHFSFSEMKDKYNKIVESGLPFLIAQENEKILGYAYLADHRPKKGYRFTKEITAYIAKGQEGKGIGTALYKSIFEWCKSSDLKTIVAGITFPNEASVKLHKKFGFREIGVFRKVGYKFGKFLDVLWMEKHL